MVMGDGPHAGGGEASPRFADVLIATRSEELSGGFEMVMGEVEQAPASSASMIAFFIAMFCTGGGGGFVASGVAHHDVLCGSFVGFGDTISANT